MIALRVKVQLLVFALVTGVAVVYAGLNLFHLGSVVRPPYLVSVQFAHAGNIYPRAEVTLLGTPIGRVTDVKAGPGTATTVVLAIDEGIEVPSDVKATMANKSAIGEPYVDLTPRSGRGPLLADGDVIALKDTVPSIEVSQVVGNLGALARSVPTKDLATTLHELSTAVNGVAPDLGRLLTNANTVARTSLDSVADLTSLIQSASVVLRTQVDVGPETETYLRHLALLTTTLREVDPQFDQMFANGVRASASVTNLLRANQAALPALLTDLLTVTDVAADRVPQLRKTLVVFPWMYEHVATALRYCDSYDSRTGEPVAGTCHYDEQGRPVWSAHLAFQLPELPGKPPYFPCSHGYEGTRKHLPDGRPLDGNGPVQGPDAEPNLDARCTSSPTDPTQPNVRGSQNVQSPGDRPARQARGFAIYDPASGVVATSDGSAYQLRGLRGTPPPAGTAGLSWLLTAPMSGAAS